MLRNNQNSNKIGPVLALELRRTEVLVPLRYEVAAAKAENLRRLAALTPRY